MQLNLDQLGNAVPLVALAVVAFVIYLFMNLPAGKRHYNRRYFGRGHRATSIRAIYAGNRDISDSTQQLAAVMEARFEKQRILHPNEYRAFRAVEQHFAAMAKGHRVFAQTNLGEILSSKDEAAFRSINSKRVDILVIDRGGWPVLAVEYQGSGHHRGTAAARDAVKKEALRRAGVAYVEAYPGDTDEQIRVRIDEVLARLSDGARRVPGQLSVQASDAGQEPAHPPSGSNVVAS